MERIFRNQLDKLVTRMKADKHIWGLYLWHAQHIEYQRTGNPHAHFVWSSKVEATPEQVDIAIQSYWPHPSHPAYKFMHLMIHHHSDRCTKTKKGKHCSCSYKFPRPASATTTFDPYGYVTYKRYMGDVEACRAFSGTELCNLQKM